jgi:hypothetical protein
MPLHTQQATPSPCSKTDLQGRCSARAHHAW